MKHQEHNWHSTDGIKMFGQSWQPDGESKAVVQLVHGMGEHSTRYSHLAEYLTGKGYALASFDLRGHGQSGGTLGHTPDLTHLFDDISIFLKHFEETLPHKKRFLMGHSLGGNLVLGYTLRRDPALTGVIASSPWLGLYKEPNVILKGLIAVLDKVAPSMSLASGIETDALSRDSQVIQDYLDDPKVHDRISFRMVSEVMRSAAYTLKHADRFPLPLLLYQGGSDRVVSPAATREFAEKCGSDLTFKVWEQMYHEPHNEPEKAEVFELITDWLDRRLG